MKRLLLLFLLSVYMFSQGQVYNSIKNISGNNCSEIAFREYNTLKELYLKEVRSNLKILSRKNNKFYFKKDADTLKVFDDNEIKDNKYEFFYPYKNYKIYGRSSSADILYSLDIVKDNHKHIETVSFINNGDIIVDILRGRYKKQEFYSVDPFECSYFTVDTYMSDVSVGKSVMYEKHQAINTDWDELYTIKNDALIKLLPDLYSKAIEIQKEKIRNGIGKKNGGDRIFNNDDVIRSYKVLDNFSVQFKNDLKSGKRNIKFEKGIDQTDGVPTWIIQYGIVILVNGNTGEIKKVVFPEHTIID